jgi:uncharacterized integral membrane protein
LIQFVRLAALVILVAYTTLFVLQNGDRVTMALPFITQGSMPGWLVVLIAAAFGGGVSALLLSWPLLRFRHQNRRDARRIHALEQELHGLRTLPLATNHPGHATHVGHPSSEAPVPPTGG